MTLPQATQRGVGAYYDPLFSKVVLLLQNVGSGASIVDHSNSALSITKKGTVSQVTSGAAFGMPGYGFPSTHGGVVHNIVTGYSSALSFLAAGPWAMECRFNVVGLPASYGGGPAIPAGSYLMSLMGTTRGWNSTTGMHAALLLTSSGKLQFWWYTGGTSKTSAEHSATIALNQDHYVRLSHDGAGTLTFEVNGVSSTHACSPVSPGNAPRFVSGDANELTADAAYYILRGTVWAARLTSDAQRPQWVGNHNLPFPVNKGSANIYVPGDGSGGPPDDDATAPKGQWITTTPNTFMVPADVTKVSVVCIGMTASIGGTDVCRAQNGALLGDLTGAGGLGGDGGTFRELVPNPSAGGGGAAWGGGEPTYIWYEGVFDGGGGGAGGYGAAGGNGGDISGRPSGAGAGGRNATYTNNGAGAGSGASLRGTTPGGGTLYGGGLPGSGGVGQPGNALAAVNDLAVTPGQVITFSNSAGGNNSRAARVMWGGSRSFPHNAGDV